ncbi:cytochrome b [Pseudothauera nasutitermitis]|uniref:Cytochrome b n=1 Tax=Pseudothauera nasutitermitis TaxID=2565930 RepID=A0A4V6RX60_9RHOO|nr:cytochrome b [Pseudothauera nasutitermitis]THF63019.1 cytochrome b [Pseudothauera nasutitermitis]
MLKNSDLNYGLVAKTLHWVTALLFLTAYAAVYYRHWFTEPRTPENWTALQLHLSFGVSIGVLALLRIVWSLANKRPRAEPGSRLAHLAAHGGHLALYAVLIVMPLTGYLGTGVATELFFLFDVPKFEDTYLFKTVVEGWMGLGFKEFEQPMDFIHKNGGAYLVWLLILGHAGAALYHHYTLEDRTLLKMTTGRG